MEGRYAGTNAGTNAGINIIQPRLAQCQEILIMGIETHTSNQREANPQTATIPQLWSQFLTEQLWLTIPDVVNPQVLYGVYTDYQTHAYTGVQLNAVSQYRLIVATEVSNIDNPPEHMVGIAIPPARYLVFSAVGAPVEAARQTWQQIWDYFSPADLPYQRAYSTDFECYKSDQLSIYVAVK
jgi:predicted transcriptional regulator YdeE